MCFLKLNTITSIQFMVELRRVELLTSCLQGRRSSQLSYSPIFVYVLIKSTLKSKQFVVYFYIYKYEINKNSLESKTLFLSP